MRMWQHLIPLGVLIVRNSGIGQKRSAPWGGGGVGGQPLGVSHYQARAQEH